MSIRPRSWLWTVRFNSDVEPGCLGRLSFQLICLPLCCVVFSSCVLEEFLSRFVEQYDQMDLSASRLRLLFKPHIMNCADMALCCVHTEVVSVTRLLTSSRTRLSTYFHAFLASCRCVQERDIYCSLSSAPCVCCCGCCSADSRCCRFSHVEPVGMETVSPCTLSISNYHTAPPYTPASRPPLPHHVLLSLTIY